MEFLELKEDRLKEIVENNDKVMVQFGAAWCGTCRLMKPKFKRMSTQNEDIQFVYVDAEKLPQSRTLAKVENLPTFAAYKGGALVSQQAGSKSEILDQLLNEVTSN